MKQQISLLHRAAFCKQPLDRRISGLEKLSVEDMPVATSSRKD
jgi:hypothetical protein